MKKQKIKIGVCITGSFCNHAKTLEQMKLLEKEYDIFAIVSENVKAINTRFGKSEDFLAELKAITKKDIISTISEAEVVGPKNLADILVVLPCTGNTLAKMANAVTDTSVLMAIKSHIRNNKPVVIGIASNDGLGASLQNISTMLNNKNIYFIPFNQDDYIGKPKSLVCKFEKTIETIKEALNGRQIQPILWEEK